jgi:hypothetical protein
MGSVAIPIRQIQATAQFGTGLRLSPVAPKWPRSLLTALLFPKILRYLNAQLSNERLAALSKEDAAVLYAALGPLHREVCRMVDEWHPRLSWPARALTRHWIRTIDFEAARMGDVVEALAWGADAELRDFVDSSVNDLKQYHLHV